MSDSKSGSLESLPPDWWKRPRSHDALRDFVWHLSRYILYLRVPLPDGTRDLHNGVLLENNDGLVMWASVSHIRDDLREPLRRAKTGMIAAKWQLVDGRGELRLIPAQLREMNVFVPDECDVDFLVAIVPEEEAREIRDAGGAEAGTPSLWKNSSYEAVEGYWLVGYPDQVRSRFENDPGVPQPSASIVPICVPVASIAPDDGRFYGLSRDHELFYGEAYLESNAPGLLLNDLGGMSGCPLFSLRRLYEEQKIRYRLVGLLRGIRSELQDNIIVVEPILRVVKRSAYSGRLGEI